MFVVVTVVAVTAFVLSAVAVSNVLPPASQCHPAPSASRSIDGHTYCYATVPWPTSGLLVNYTEWGFAFQLRQPLSTTFALEAAISEPLNGTFYGAIICNGPSCAPGTYSACDYPPQWGGSPTSCQAAENASSPSWFIPDNDAGVMFSLLSHDQALELGNLTLLVAA